MFTLAKRFVEGKHNPLGWMMSEKFDGIRAIWTGKEFWSRNEKPIFAPKFFTEKFPNH